MLAIPSRREAVPRTTLTSAEAATLAPVRAAAADSFATLASLQPDELADIDLARLNLLAADGLPGAEDLDVNAALAELDRWAAHVRFETDRHLYKFHEAPEEYENSEAYFRVLMLIVVMQADLGVHYNPERIDKPDFTNAKDLFVHGMIGAPETTSGGTCVSMPALYVAVGRRLDYPLHLVVTKGHVFARWDAPRHPNPYFRGRFNIEGTNRGLGTPDDEHYRNWPYELTEAEVNNDWFLRSLTPAEAFAVFLMQAGPCLEDTGRLPDAQVAYAMAHRLAPKSPQAIQYLANAVRSEALAMAGVEPEAVASGQRRAEQEAWLREQRRRAEQHVQDVLRQQEQRHIPTTPGRPAGPGIPGVPGGTP